jgi:hypothetical protein
VTVRNRQRTLRVAILASEPLGWGSGKHFFQALLQGYTWTANDTRYDITVDYLDDTDILQGRLTVDAFDVLVVPGGGVGDGHAIIKGIWLWPHARRWKQRIAAFVKDGGGYVGICGGAALMTDLQTKEGKPRRFLERLYRNSALGVSCVSSYYRTFAFPLMYPFQSRHPEDVGAAAYVFSFAPGVTCDGAQVHTGGAPVDFRVDTHHPVFAGAKPVVRVRWWGGPGLIVPPQPDREVQVLAWYPEVDLSENPSARIFAWRYIGGLWGLKKAVMDAFRLVKAQQAPLHKVFLYTYYFAGGWQRTDRPIILDQAQRPAVTVEVYPNERKGRILLCTAHPEYMTWKDGRIVEDSKQEGVTIGTGFRRWEGVEPLPVLLATGVTATWWMVRRFVAWAAKLPAEDFPPVDAAVLSEDDRMRLLPYLVWDGSQANQFLTI